MKKILVVFICLSLLLCCSACGREPDPTGISKAEYDKLYTGMYYEDVVEIIGGEGEKISEQDKSEDGYTENVFTYHFEGETNGYAEMEFTYHFDYDDVMPKVTVGKLTKITQYDLS